MADTYHWQPYYQWHSYLTILKILVMITICNPDALPWIELSLLKFVGYSVIVALTGLPIGYSVKVALTGLPIGYSVIVALTGLPIGYSVKVALTGLPIGYSVKVALTGLPIGYSVIVALTGLPIGCSVKVGESESTILAVQDQVLFATVYQAKIMRCPVLTCLCWFCYAREETLQHLLAGCKILVPTKYLYWHNMIARVVHWHLCATFHISLGAARTTTPCQ